MIRREEDLRDLRGLFKDATEVELCKLATKEILEQFSECVANYKKMIAMYPLLKVTVAVALQIRFCDETQITCLTGVEKTLREALRDMTFQLNEGD